MPFFDVGQINKLFLATNFVCRPDSYRDSQGGGALTRRFWLGPLCDCGCAIEGGGRQSKLISGMACRTRKVKKANWRPGIRQSGFFVARTGVEPVSASWRIRILPTFFVARTGVEPVSASWRIRILPTFFVARTGVEPVSAN